MSSSFSSNPDDESIEKRISHFDLKFAGMLALTVIILIGTIFVRYVAYRSDTFTIQIQSDTSWSGTISSSIYGYFPNSTTVNDSGNASYRATGMLVKVDVKKQTDAGYLTVTIVLAGKITDSQTTNTSYGEINIKRHS